LAAWEAAAPLPKSANRNTCLDTLDKLHRLDGLSWDRIATICDHATRRWVPQGFIHTPAKLRKSTKSGEMATWEAIERQIEHTPKTAANGMVGPSVAETLAKLKKEAL